MYRLIATSRFTRDVKTCRKRHWDMGALKFALTELAVSDTVPMSPRLRDHQLTGSLAGHRSLHVDSAPNPAKDTWVLMYQVDGRDLYLERTGTHDEVYGR